MTDRIDALREQNKRYKKQRDAARAELRDAQEKIALAMGVVEQVERDDQDTLNLTGQHLYGAVVTVAERLRPILEVRNDS